MSYSLTARDNVQGPALATLRSGGLGRIDMLSDFQGEPPYRQVVSNTPVTSEKVDLAKTNDTGVLIFVDNEARKMEVMKRSHLRSRARNTPSVVYSLSALNYMFLEMDEFRKTDHEFVFSLLRRFDFAGVNKHAASIVSAASYNEGSSKVSAAMAIATHGHAYAINVWASHFHPKSYVYAHVNAPNGGVNDAELESILRDKNRLMDKESPGVLDELYVVMKVVKINDDPQSSGKRKAAGAAPGAAAAAAAPAAAPAAVPRQGVLPDNYAWQMVPFVAKYGIPPTAAHYTAFVEMDPAGSAGVLTPFVGRCYYIGRVLEEPAWGDENKSQSAMREVHPKQLRINAGEKLDLQMSMRRLPIMVSGRP